MAKSKIEWTERTWNPVTGCTKVSPGCKNCYAETIANRFWKDRKFTDVECHKDRLQIPLKRKKPTMYFVNSMSDLFHKDVPITFIDSVYEVMGWSQQHIFQILTKRPKRMWQYYQQSSIFDAWGEWGNIWVGVSVEDQKTADERIPILLDTPAVNRFISIEPLLEDIGKTFLKWTMEMEGRIKRDNIWVIVGGESGPKARVCHVEWIADIVKICQIQNIPVFVKQLGSNPMVYDSNIPRRLNKGKNNNIDDFPVRLQVREYPAAMKK